MRILLAVLLLAGCVGKFEAKKWRAAKRVFVPVDLRNTDPAAPPAFMQRQNSLMVYLSEDAIPPKTGYTAMSPHQAAEMALKTGLGGLCVDPSGPACTRRLKRGETEALEKELKAETALPEAYALTVKP
jgi:hypothetical protein